MLKNCLKNYFINLKYYFTPIGALAIGLAIGLSVLIPGAIHCFSDFLNKVGEISGSTQINIEEVFERAAQLIGALDWAGDPVAALQTMLTAEWLNEFFRSCLEVISAQLAPYSQQINEAWEVAVGELTAYFAVFVTFTLLGIAGGFSLTRFLIRRNIARRAFWKIFLAGAVDFILAFALVAFSVWLSTVWTAGGYISAVLSFFVYSLTSLCSAFIVHGKKGLNPRKVISFKNAVLLPLGNILVFLIAALFTVAAVLITNAIAGIFIGYSFIIIALLVASLNAEAFVKNIVEKIA